jgi:acylphosphatase
MLVARRFVLSGRVQGVGFRFFAEDAASREGIVGWVQNRPDGAVEILAEGDAEALDRFEARVRRGPPLARVERVKTERVDATGLRRTFTIRE